MRFDQLTIKAQEAVSEAQRDERARGIAELTPDHLLLSLLKQEEGVVVPVLHRPHRGTNGARRGRRRLRAHSLRESASSSTMRRTCRSKAPTPISASPMICSRIAPDA